MSGTEILDEPGAVLAKDTSMSTRDRSRSELNLSIDRTTYQALVLIENVTVVDTLTGDDDLEFRNHIGSVINTIFELVDHLPASCLHEPKPIRLSHDSDILKENVSGIRLIL